MVRSIPASAVALPLVAATLAGCGTHQSPVPLSDLPSCGDIWKVGKTLPPDYGGFCFVGDPDLTAPAKGRCRVFVNGHLWATAGGVVHRSPERVKQDVAYRRALNSC